MHFSELAAMYIRPSSGWKCLFYSHEGRWFLLIGLLLRHGFSIPPDQKSCRMLALFSLLHGLPLRIRCDVFFLFLILSFPFPFLGRAGVPMPNFRFLEAVTRPKVQREGQAMLYL